MPSENKEEFYNWHIDFVKRNGGLKIPKVWFDEVEESHKPIRELLGGISKTFSINLKDVKTDVPFSQIHEYTWNLARLIPHYFHETSLKRKDLLSPLVSDGQQVGMKRAKHIKFWMDKNGIDEKVVKEVNDILSKLGEKWSLSKTEETTMKIVVSTDPRAFCMIGHYGPDNQSCFRQRQANQLHKYNLGRHLNSYVVLIGESDDLLKEYVADISPVFGRMWGIANKDLTIFSVSNYYPKKGIKEANVLWSVTSAFGQLLNLGTKVPAIHDKQITVTNVYHNQGFNRSFCSPETPFTTQNIVVKAYNPYDIKLCALCKNHFFLPETLQVDGSYVCKECEPKMEECFITKEKHIALYNAKVNGKKVKISYVPINDGRFIIIPSYDNLYRPVEDFVHLRDGSYMPRDVAKERKYEECLSCKMWSHWSQIRKTDDSDEKELCTFCIKLKSAKELAQKLVAAV